MDPWNPGESVEYLCNSSVLAAIYFHFKDPVVGSSFHLPGPENLEYLEAWVHAKPLQRDSNSKTRIASKETKASMYPSSNPPFGRSRLRKVDISTGPKLPPAI